MSFRRRITLASAAAVAVAVVLASLLTYLLAAHQLHDRSTKLRTRSAAALHRSRERAQQRTARRAGHSRIGDGRAQRLLVRYPGLRRSRRRHAERARLQPVRQPHPPPRPGARLPAAGRTPAARCLFAPRRASRCRSTRRRARWPPRADAVLPQMRARAASTCASSPSARRTRLRRLQLAQPLTERRRIAAPPAPDPRCCCDIGGDRAGGAARRLVAGAAVAPVKRLTAATEHVTRTQDLSERIEPAGER